MYIITLHPTVWRAGFREGVKMALDRGAPTYPRRIFKWTLEESHRLWIWLMIGSMLRMVIGQY